jgi:hypothetical protein
MRVSKVGVDVKTATEDELIISSDFKNVKRSVQSSIISQLVTNTGGNWEYDFPHGLSYIPTFRVFYDLSDGNWRDGVEDSEFTGGLPDVMVRSCANSTNIHVSVFNFDVSDYTVRLKVFCFIERVK